jgi:lambda repressor-like predicted transcriptional regulator
LRMSKDWRARLIEMIEKDGRSLRAISAAAPGVGENYLQQMLKNEKEPTFPRLASVLSVLGPDAAVYVTTGIRLGTQDQLRATLAANGMPPNELETVLSIIQRFIPAASAEKPAHSQSHDLSPSANRPHESTPSGRQPQRSTS